MSTRDGEEALFPGELTMTTDQRMHELEEQFQELALMQKTLMSKMSETNDQMLLILRTLLSRLDKDEKSNECPSS